MNVTQCPNFNHRRTDPPVAFCPSCGAVVNDAIAVKQLLFRLETLEGDAFFILSRVGTFVSAPDPGLIMSSTLASGGRFTVLLMAPERKGCTAPIMRMWPIQWIERSPFTGRNAQSKTGRCASPRPGAPSMVSRSSTWATMASISSAP